MTGRIRGALVPLALVLAGCASTRASLPDWAPDILKPTSVVFPAPASAPSSAPVAPPPAVVQILTLAAPGGGSGRLTLTRTISFVREAREDAKNVSKPGDGHTTVTTYSGTGSIRVSDDLGQWTFSYVPVSLRDPAKEIQALGIRLEGAAGEGLAVDWDDSALVEPTGTRHRVAHRGDVAPGSEAAIWVGDIGFESMPTGLTLTVALTLRRGETRPVRTFGFESRRPEVAAETAPTARPISRWVAERFVALPRPPWRRDDVYEALAVSDKIGRHPTPEEMAGAVLEVTSVKYDRLTPIVTFAREDTHQQYVARAPGDIVEDLAPLADIESASKEWRGKALWLAMPELQTLGEGSDNQRVVPVKRLARVEVVDVRLGWSSHAPIRFILKTAEGLLGFRDVHTSGTNVPEAQRQRHAFARAFYTQDPRGEFDWPEEVWAAIENSRVAVGMTTAQARMSWGEPRRVEPWFRGPDGKNDGRTPTGARSSSSMAS